jgi:hypothetical protein
MIARSNIGKTIVSAVIAVAALGAGSALADGRDSVYAFGKRATPAKTDIVTARQGRGSLHAADVRTTPRAAAQGPKGSRIAGNGRGSVYAGS